MSNPRNNIKILHTNEVKIFIQPKKSLPNHSWYRIKHFLYDDEFAKIASSNKFIYALWKNDRRFVSNGDASDKRIFEMYQQAQILSIKLHKGNKDRNKLLDICEVKVKSHYLSKNVQFTIFNVIRNLSPKSCDGYNNNPVADNGIALLEAMLNQYMFMYKNFKLSYIEYNPLILIYLYLDIKNNNSVLKMIEFLRVNYLDDYYQICPQILYRAIENTNLELFKALVSEIQNNFHSHNIMIFTEALKYISKINNNIGNEVFNRNEMLNLLIQSGADVVKQDREESLLYDSISKQFVTITQTFLVNGADPNNRINQISPLEYALSFVVDKEEDSAFKIIKMLFEFGAKMDIASLLERAMKQNSSCVTKFLFSSRIFGEIDPNFHDSSGYPFIYNASENENGLLLLNYGANPCVRSKNGETPLMRAAAYCNVPMLSKLLSGEYKIDVNEMNDAGETSLSLAAGKLLYRNINDRISTIHLLLQARANIEVLSQKNHRQLFSYGFCNPAYLSLISIFLDRNKIDINEYNHRGYTLIMTAIENGAFNIANYLMAKNIDVKLKSYTRESTIDYLIAYRKNHSFYQLWSGGEFKICLFNLLDAGVEIKSVNALCLLESFLGLVLNDELLFDLRKLLSYKQIRSNINSSLSNGNTLLIEAIRNRNSEMILTLLESKADPNLLSKNGDGYAPLLFALKCATLYGYDYKDWVENVIDPLLDHGANPYTESAWNASGSDIFKMRDSSAEESPERWRLRDLGLFSRYHISNNNLQLELTKKMSL